MLIITHLFFVVSFSALTDMANSNVFCLANRTKRSREIATGR